MSFCIFNQQRHQADGTQTTATSPMLQRKLPFKKTNFMTLSERATKYFGNLKRMDEFSLDKEKTIEYCARQNFPLTERLLDVQTKFSGYKLTIKNDRGHGFLLRLFAKYDFDENREIEFYFFGENYVVDFGEHDTAPFHFYITNEGELCTLGHHDGDTPNIVCSSIEKYIEQYALLDQLALQSKNPYYHDILNIEKLSELLERDFNKIEECSDKYSQWFTDGQLTINRGPWLDRPEYYLHVYGRKKESCDKFVDDLKQSKIIA